MLIGTAQEKISWVTADNASNILVCGYLPYSIIPAVLEDVFGSNLGTISGTGSNTGFVFKYDARGQFKWALEFDGAGDDRCNALAIDNEGNVIAVGQSSSSPMNILWNTRNDVVKSIFSQGIGAFLVKLDPDGNLIWVTQVDGQIDDSALAVKTDRIGDIFFGGRNCSTHADSHLRPWQ